MLRCWLLSSVLSSACALRLSWHLGALNSRPQPATVVEDSPSKLHDAALLRPQSHVAPVEVARTDRPAVIDQQALSVPLLPNDHFNRAFAVIDENDTGRISVDELASFLRKSYRAAPTLHELQLLLDDYDDNGNGLLEVEEFCDLMTRPASSFRMDTIRQKVKLALHPIMAGHGLHAQTG